VLKRLELVVLEHHSDAVHTSPRAAALE
jgi:hypothetical protein